MISWSFTVRSSSLLPPPTSIATDGRMGTGGTYDAQQFPCFFPREFRVLPWTTGVGRETAAKPSGATFDLVIDAVRGLSAWGEHDTKASKPLLLSSFVASIDVFFKQKHAQAFRSLQSVSHI